MAFDYLGYISDGYFFCINVMCFLSALLITKITMSIILKIIKTKFIQLLFMLSLYIVGGSFVYFGPDNEELLGIIR